MSPRAWLCSQGTSGDEFSLPSARLHPSPALSPTEEPSRSATASDPISTIKWENRHCLDEHSSLSRPELCWGGRHLHPGSGMLWGRGRNAAAPEAWESPCSRGVAQGCGRRRQMPSLFAFPLDLVVPTPSKNVRALFSAFLNPTHSLLLLLRESVPCNALSAPTTATPNPSFNSCPIPDPAAVPAAP